MLNLHHSCVLAGAALAIALQACTVRDTQVQPPPAAPATAPETFRRIEIDTRKPLGTLRSLQGVNGAPAPGFHKPEDFLFGEWNIPESWDATPGYREARIDLVRTHDAYGPGDIDPIFGPDEVLAAAPTQEFDARWGDPTDFVTRCYRSLWAHYAPDA